MIKAELIDSSEEYETTGFVASQPQDRRLDAAQRHPVFLFGFPDSAVRHPGYITEGLRRSTWVE
jgi:hypothetical protein